jgi:hypothetical protein
LIPLVIVIINKTHFFPVENCFEPYGWSRDVLWGVCPRSFAVLKDSVRIWKGEEDYEPILVVMKDMLVEGVSKTLIV